MTVGLLRLALNNGGGIVQTGGVAVVFTLLVGSMFGIALGVLPEVSAHAAPAVILLCVMLSAMLSLETVWHRPLASGCVDLLLLSGRGSLEVATAMLFAHWLLAGLPLVVAGFVLALMLNMAVTLSLVLSIALVSFYLSATGAVAALLSHGARYGGVLLVVLILPLQVPMMILSLLALSDGQLDPQSSNPYLYLQAALVVFATLPLLALSAWLLRAAHAR